MKQDFDYAYDYVATAQLQLDSIGNTCIKAVNDIGDTWYLIVDTQLGVTNLTMFGPVYLEGTQLQKKFSFYKETFDYNENKICKQIEKLLNDEKKFVSQATEIDRDEAISRLKEIFYENCR